MSEEYKEVTIASSVDYSYIGRVKAITNYKRRDNIVCGVKLSGYGYLAGGAYEKTDQVSYQPVKYILIHYKTGSIVDEYTSLDGKFIFTDININEKFSIVILDLSSKYIGKYIDNIQPQLDYKAYLLINKLYSHNNEAYFKLRYSGTHTLSLIGSGTLVKIDEFNYKVINITGEYTLSLVDYVESEAFILEKTYK